MVSVSTRAIALSQHFVMPGTAAPAAVVVGEVWARAATTLPASIAAAAITLIPVIRASPVVVNHHERFVGTTDANLSGFLFGRRRVNPVCDALEDEKYTWDLGDS